MKHAFSAAILCAALLAFIAALPLIMLTCAADACAVRRARKGQ